MLKNFDIFPKAAENDLKVRTNTGGLLTIISMVFLISCIAAEIKEYTIVRVSNQMVLNDQPPPLQLPIVIDADIYNNCSDLHFEITNAKRTMFIDSKITKKFTQDDDVCHVHVEAVAPNIPASCHIGLGESYSLDNGAHQHLWYTLTNRNLSHKINYIRFGDVPIASPVDGISNMLVKDATYMFTYALQLVPVVQNEKTGYLAIASMSKTNLDKIRTRGITALVFEWDFSPIGLQRSSYHEPVINLVSHLLALCGCFFVFVRFIDAIVFSITNH